MWLYMAKHTPRFLLCGTPHGRSGIFQTPIGQNRDLLLRREGGGMSVLPGRVNGKLAIRVQLSTNRLTLSRLNSGSLAKRDSPSPGIQRRAREP